MEGGNEMSMSINETYLRNLASIFPEDLLDKTMEHIKLESAPSLADPKDTTLPNDRRTNMRTDSASAIVKIVRHNRGKVFSPFMHSNACRLLNISAAGLAIHTAFRMHRGDTVDLDIKSTDGGFNETCRVAAKVRRIKKIGQHFFYGLEAIAALPNELKGIVNAKVIRQKVKNI
jgi:hypothetical protein